MLIESGFDVNAVDNVRTILLIILPMACLMWVLYVKCLLETLKKHLMIKIVKVIRPVNTLKFLSNAIMVYLHNTSVRKISNFTVNRDHSLKKEGNKGDHLHLQIF